MPRQTTKLILKAGIIAGTLDILAAIVAYGFILSKAPVIKILQSIASGIYGVKAFAGGWGMAIQGLIFHYLIAIIFAFLFYLLIKAIPLIVKFSVITGLLYGIIIWLIMNLLVLPASQVPPRSFSTRGMIEGMLILMFFVGLPISVVLSKGVRR
ncbi:hypothetical protein [uncultured Chitinophaga sp.]|uniref:hypothetical protein n=1 Tax=uncultured Chitinophaga sp. TaxID=339340 RepID=UPI0025F44AC1|nr:hypothetical protein [uncultured Chitinophaga sp.]